MADTIQKVVDVLQSDLQWHKELAVVLNNKLDAMRQYDLSRLESLTAAEQRLTDSISGNEQQRFTAIRQATAIYFPQRTGRLATARELASVVKGPLKEKLNALAAMLIDATKKVQRLNKVNALATEKIVGHVDQIFDLIAKSGRDIGLYGRRGKKTIFEQNRLVDAIA